MAFAIKTQKNLQISIFKESIIFIRGEDITDPSISPWSGEDWFVLLLEGPVEGCFT